MKQDKDEKIFRIYNWRIISFYMQYFKEGIRRLSKIFKIKNIVLENKSEEKQQLVSGRALLSRMEGEFTRLNQIYGNHIIFLGTDGDLEWGNRNTRFLKPYYTDQILKLKFTITQKVDTDNEFGKIIIDYQGNTQDNELIVISKKNIYKIKKEPPQ